MARFRGPDICRDDLEPNCMNIGVFQRRLEEAAKDCITAIEGF
jgi:hypothetical protein